MFFHVSCVTPPISHSRCRAQSAASLLNSEVKWGKCAGGTCVLGKTSGFFQVSRLHKKLCLRRATQGPKNHMARKTPVSVGVCFFAPTGVQFGQRNNLQRRNYSPTEQLVFVEGGVASWREGILAFAENAGVSYQGPWRTRAHCDARRGEIRTAGAFGDCTCCAVRHGLRQVVATSCICGRQSQPGRRQQCSAMHVLQ